MRNVDLREKDYSPNLHAMICFPEALARRFACFPVSMDDHDLLILAVSQTDWESDRFNVKRNQISEEIGISSGIKLHFVLAPTVDILWAVETFYKTLPPVQKPTDSLSSLRASHGDDPLHNTADEVGELPEGGANKPYVLHLQFKSAKHAGLFIVSIA